MNRRDFLKLLSVLPPAFYLPPSITQVQSSGNPAFPNIIVIVFDAWSAMNMSLYGYPRQTTPYLDRLAEKAIVYHNHYAGGHSTPPGTATFLTGVLPWKHHLYGEGTTLNSEFSTKNLFSLFPEYYRIAYTHNTIAEEKVLLKMHGEMDQLKPHEDLFLRVDPISKVFQQDYDIASLSWIKTTDTISDGFANSLFLSRLWASYNLRVEKSFENQFPLGLPKTGDTNPFVIEDALNWLVEFLQTQSSASLSYFHLLPPHTPYNTRNEFHRVFDDDGYLPLEKPQHFMARGFSYEALLFTRQRYDEYIRYVDAEFYRLYTLLEQNDILKNSWLILTSDHGEIFERGLRAHRMPSFYDPLVKIPLLIFPPNLEKRVDISTPTSAIDILPSLLSITGKKPLSWIEGNILPPFSQDYPDDHPIFIPDANKSVPGKPSTDASLMLRRGNYKLIHHFGSREIYKPLNGGAQTELYDLQNDPEETENLFEQKSEIGNSLLNELLSKCKEMGVTS